MARTIASAAYRALMTELERRRHELRWPMWMLDDKAGTQDGYYAKMLHPDTPSGKKARWETIQLLIDAMFPEGFDFILIPKKGAEHNGLSMKEKTRQAMALYDSKTQRQLMSDLGKKSVAARMVKIPPKKRRAIARKAGIASGKARKRRALVLRQAHEQAYAV